jgi:hypothetical protein
MSRRLFQAIIIQAFQDIQNSANTGEQRAAKTAAITWLTGNSKDFRKICEWADLEPEDVERAAHKALTFGLVLRKPNGQGSRYLEMKERKDALSKKDKPPHHSIIPND